MAIKMGITGLVITKNEEANITGCLESMSWCDELIIVDSFSTDNTVAVAQALGACVIQHEFHDYGSQKRFAIEQTSYNWILMIDADERVTPELRNEIALNLQSSAMGAEDIAGYQIPMMDFMFGKYIYHGGWCGYYRVSLFRKDRVIIENEVHEKISVQGLVKKMNNYLLHFSHFSIEHFIFKLNKYTSLEAKSAYNAGQRTSILKVVTLPFIVFCYKYFWKLGFLDGLQGYALAFMMGMYHFARHVKLLILQNDANYRNNTRSVMEKFKVYPRHLP